jgi:hemerythrin-like domain-containing protein
MTAPLSMNTVIHGAVRRDLDRLSTGLGQLRDGDTARAAGLARAFAHLRAELTRHHEGEDAHIWPMLEKAGEDRDLLSAMESEHGAMADSLAEADGAMQALARSGSAADAETARAAMDRTREVVDRHLDHEESDLEPVIARYADTPEWKAVEKKLRSAPLGVVGGFFAWLTDGMGDEHRAYLRATVPPPVVFVFSRVFGRDYRRDVAPVWS